MVRTTGPAAPRALWCVERPHGFVALLDERTVALPDRPGNRRLDSLHNILGNPGVGLLFLIPGIDEIPDDASLRARFAVGGREPAMVLRINLHQAYLHCAKALMRSRLWDTQARVPRSALATMGEMLKDQCGLSGEPESEEALAARYCERLS